MNQDFRNTKIKILSEDHSRAIQEAVFEAGGKWRDSGEFYLRDVDFIFVHGSLSMSLCGNAVFFHDHDYKEIQFPLPTKGHIHAELMVQYAEDAKTTDTPWELWQVKCDAGIWWNCREHPKWGSATEYRRKPKTKLIHGVEIPDIGLDLSKCEGRTDFYVPCVLNPKYYLGLAHHKHHNCIRYSQIGIAYPYTEEGKQAAILHAKAMLECGNQLKTD